MTAPLTCPGCGAAASPDASRCEFCGSALVKIACPSCFGALFEGMRFCPHCGARADRADLDQAPVDCPGCSTRMRPIQLGGATLHECPQCVSCWTSTDTFLSLCANRENRGGLAAAVGANPLAGSKKPFAGVRYLECPSCKKLMNRMNFGRRSGVIVDVCSGHGVWFEHQELRLVLEFIDSGGMERARAAQREQLAEERRLIEWKVRELARERARQGTHPPATGMIEAGFARQGGNADSPLLQVLQRLLG